MPHNNYVNSLVNLLLQVTRSCDVSGVDREENGNDINFIKLIKKKNLHAYKHFYFFILFGELRNIYTTQLIFVYIIIIYFRNPFFFLFILNLYNSTIFFFSLWIYQVYNIHIHTRTY